MTHYADRIDRRLLPAVAALALVALPPLASARPGPTAAWSSTLARPRLAPALAGTYVYRATAADALTLTVTLAKLPAQLRLLRVGTTPYRLVAGRASWTLHYAPGEAVTQRIAIRVRVVATARLGSTLCVTLRQTAESGGGVPDVVPKRSCGPVQRP